MVGKQDSVIPKAGIHIPFFLGIFNDICFKGITESHGIARIATSDGNQRKSVCQGCQVAGGKIH